MCFASWLSCFLLALICFALLMSVFCRDAFPGISLHSSGIDQHCSFALSDRFGYAG
jgi:hypothetical protein